MLDMSIQEMNGKGPKKRKKSLERICDNEGKGAPEAEKNEIPEEKYVGGVHGEKKDGDEGGGNVELLHWRDMPQHLQFNPYVLTGYRPLQGWTDCVRSLFYFHNETINILTHGNFNIYNIREPDPTPLLILVPYRNKENLNVP